MAINKYFNAFQEPNEQDLLSDLFTEAISIFGQNIYYIPRTQVNTNPILGEDATSVFQTVYEIEAYLENVDGFEGDKNFLSNLGLQIKKSSNFLISDARFKEMMQHGPFNVPNTEINPNKIFRPFEGDLIYFPLTKGLFEIKFADHETIFYQLGRIYTWRLTVEMFKYSNEVINTGVKEIDAIAIQFHNANNTNNDPLADNTNMQNVVDPIEAMDFEGPRFTDGIFTG